MNNLCHSRRHCNRWYLTPTNKNERKQRISLANQSSDYMPVSYGVPQGSVLGPTLFLVYINNLCQLKLNKGNILTFADDTAIVFSGKNWKEVFNTAQTGLAQVSEWLDKNLLTLNASKTKYLSFRITQRTRPPPISLRLHSCRSTTNTTCGCTVLECVDHIKYLGIVIDHRLTFDDHIDTLRSRLRKLMHIFKRLGTVADPKTLRIVYLALCQSVISYCIVCWGSAAVTRLIKVERAQRVILKVAYKKPFRHPTDDLYNETNFLTVRQLYILAVILRFHKTAIPNAVNRKKQGDRHNTWLLPRTHTAFAQSCYSFRGPFLYQLADDVLDILDTTRFVCKKKVTHWLSTLDYRSTENILIIKK